VVPKQIGNVFYVPENHVYVLNGEVQIEEHGSCHVSGRTFFLFKPKFLIRTVEGLLKIQMKSCKSRNVVSKGHLFFSIEVDGVSVFSTNDSWAERKALEVSYDRLYSPQEVQRLKYVDALPPKELAVALAKGLVVSIKGRYKLSPLGEEIVAGDRSLPMYQISSTQLKLPIDKKILLGHHPTMIIVKGQYKGRLIRGYTVQEQNKKWFICINDTIT